jgi:hypothetical protein
MRIASENVGGGSYSTISGYDRFDLLLVVVEVRGVEEFWCLEVLFGLGSFFSPGVEDLGSESYIGTYSGIACEGGMA